MNTVVTRLSVMFNPRWWLLGSGLLLAGALLSTYLGMRRTRQWADALESADCQTPWPPGPDVTGTGWAAVFLSVAAVACLIIGVVLFLIGGHRVWMKIVVTLAGICVLPVGLVAWAFGHADATEGVDISQVTDSHGMPLCQGGG